MERSNVRRRPQRPLSSNRCEGSYQPASVEMIAERTIELADAIWSQIAKFERTMNAALGALVSHAATAALVDPF